MNEESERNPAAHLRIAQEHQRSPFVWCRRGGPNGYRYHAPTQDAVDLPKMVQVVCRFQADKLLDRLPSAYLMDPIALHPPCARDRLQ